MRILIGVGKVEHTKAFKDMACPENDKKMSLAPEVTRLRGGGEAVRVACQAPALRDGVPGHSARL